MASCFCPTTVSSEIPAGFGVAGDDELRTGESAWPLAIYETRVRQKFSKRIQCCSSAGPL